MPISTTDATVKNINFDVEGLGHKECVGPRYERGDFKRVPTPESMPSLVDKDAISEDELTYMMNAVMDAPGEDGQKSMTTGYVSLLKTSGGTRVLTVLWKILHFI